MRTKTLFREVRDMALVGKTHPMFAFAESAMLKSLRRVYMPMLWLVFTGATVWTLHKHHYLLAMCFGLFLGVLVGVFFWMDAEKFPLGKLATSIRYDCFFHDLIVSRALGMHMRRYKAMVLTDPQRYLRLVAKVAFVAEKQYLSAILQLLHQLRQARSDWGEGDLVADYKKQKTAEAKYRFLQSELAALGN